MIRLLDPLTRCSEESSLATDETRNLADVITRSGHKGRLERGFLKLDASINQHEKNQWVASGICFATIGFISMIPPGWYSCWKACFQAPKDPLGCGLAAPACLVGAAAGVCGIGVSIKLLRQDRTHVEKEARQMDQALEERLDRQRVRELGLGGAFGKYVRLDSLQKDHLRRLVIGQDLVPAAVEVQDL